MSDNKQNQKIAVTLASFYQSVIDAGGMPSWQMLNSSLFDFLCNVAAPNGIHFSYKEEGQIEATKDKVSLVVGKRVCNGVIEPVVGKRKYFVVCRPLYQGGYSLFPVSDTSPTVWKADLGVTEEFDTLQEAQDYLYNLAVPNSQEHHPPTVHSGFQIDEEDEDSEENQCYVVCRAKNAGDRDQFLLTLDGPRWTCYGENGLTFNTLREGKEALKGLNALSCTYSDPVLQLCE